MLVNKMPIHNLTDENQLQFYCRNCDERVGSETDSVLVDNIQYKNFKCGCGRDSWKIESFHKKDYPDGEVFVGTDSLDILL